MILNRYLKSLAFVLFIGIAAVSGACASAPPAPFIQAGDASTVRIVISRDFGQKIFTYKTIKITENNDALSVLKQAALVETGFGGGFVYGIDGLRTSSSSEGEQKGDWFYYVNGLEANTGAADYPLFNGDIEQWDFHSWNFRHMIPAVIGHFPQPFVNGSRGKASSTLVVYQTDFQEQANNIAVFLSKSGVRSIKTIEVDRLTEEDKQSNNLIVLAGQQDSLVLELNRQWKHLGFFAYFENGSLITIDEAGKDKAEYRQNAGLVQATQNPWNPNGIGADENTVWVITGCDEAGLNSAVNCLLKNSTLYQYSYAVVVNQGDIIKLP
jgi:hypothetical protein